MDRKKKLRRVWDLSHAARCALERVRVKYDRPYTWIVSRALIYGANNMERVFGSGTVDAAPPSSAEETLREALRIAQK